MSYLFMVSPDVVGIGSEYFYCLFSCVYMFGWLCRATCWKWRCISGPFGIFKKLKNVSCEYDRVNGWNSTLQAAWYIRYLHKLSFARVLCIILMKDIGRWLPWMHFFFIKNWKTSAVSTTMWMVETQLCKLRGTSDIYINYRSPVFYVLSLWRI